ncbi:hypothetical protein JXD38_09945 [candidate division WOR-3 bacterium]|nr:hypothetical protein [candidate division WOR-3 bacterium]
MRRVSPEVAHMLALPLTPKSIADYARLELIDRIQLSNEDLDAYARKFTGLGWRSVQDLHDAVVKHVPEIELEERLSPPISKDTGKPTRYTLAEVFETLLEREEPDKSP